MFTTLSSAALVAAMILGTTAPAMAGTTGWLDRDNVSGKGDYEDTKSHFDQQCRIKGSGQVIPTGDPVAGMPGVHNREPVGCWCINAEAQAGGGTCPDIEIKYTW